MPFNITDPDELINLATYLIEDPDNKNRVQDSTLQNTIIIKSIFRKLLGTYEGKSTYDYENCNERVEYKINQYIIILQKYLQLEEEDINMEEVEVKLRENKVI